MGSTRNTEMFSNNKKQQHNNLARERSQFIEEKSERERDWEGEKEIIKRCF